MLFSGHTVTDTYEHFIELVDNNIDLFGDVIAERLDCLDEDQLSDNDFVACYVEGMHRLVGRICEIAAEELKADEKYYERYRDAIENPGKCGFRFPNSDMTVGKVYLFYVWGKTRKRAPKSDCIKIEKHLIQRIGQQCLKYGIVS